MAKANYQAPKMEELGSFETLTQMTGDGNQLDATYPITTPKADLTFS